MKHPCLTCVFDKKERAKSEKKSPVLGCRYVESIICDVEQPKAKSDVDQKTTRACADYEVLLARLKEEHDKCNSREEGRISVSIREVGLGG